ncbi:MAG: type II toxin-antitoxin system VapC family toxin [Bacteroidetes bacterium]|nr:type II toxin-antitoxin system VapC family toxin [Bacteroidota bacterium]MBS1540813.1 type II toxin-antitoxin system VapC family toxin [Bacteroidota bacterium]
MIVVDTNTLAYHWFISPHIQAVKELLYFDGDWAAPALWRSEFRNVLASQIHFNKLTLTDAMTIWDETEKLMIRNEQSVSASSILSLAASSKCTAYDCEYVALADQLNVPLVTYDKQLLKNFSTIALTAEQYLSQFTK